MINLENDAGGRRYVAHVQTALFLSGVVLVVASTWMRNAIPLSLGGSCITASGILLLFGVHTTFRGPVGWNARAAFGLQRVRRLYVRALVWIAIGLVVTVVGLVRHHQASQSGLKTSSRPSAAITQPLTSFSMRAPRS